MNPKLIGTVVLMFIRGGIAKSGRPYLQVSNGRAELFANLPKNLDKDEFQEQVQIFEEGDEITLEVETIVGSDTIKVLSITQ